ncbi:MAG TPA: EAL domain-containing protein [Acidobacteriaceae bacterium]|jgi:sensor c-di-GMP phosphodiesterase-like protein|nr:EAL domain-containing protein [Acidobacteriaceae bacterium]
MRHSAGIAIAWTVGAAAVLAPILLSVHLARKQSTDGEFRLLRGYASDVLRRSEGTGDQSGVAIDTLENDGLTPCSPREIDVMRRIAITSSYLQAVGRTAQGQLICSSLGTDQSIDLGPPTYISRTGTLFRTNVRLPLTGGEPVIVLEREGFGVIVDPALPIDIMTESPDVAIADFAPANRRIITQRGHIDAHWLGTGSGRESDFIDRGMLVAVVRSARFDVAAVAAAPMIDVQRKVREVAFTFVPIGLFCGLALAGAVLYISRISFSMAAQLRSAARRDEFFLEYQPVVDLATRTWVGAEALVRWRRGGETVRPDLFIPAAEESGVISLITERVLVHVARDLPALLRERPAFHVSVNLSATDLQSPATLDRLRRLLASSGAPPGNLVVEATERGFLQGSAAREVVSSIRDLGVDVAIDDFGTGYSSLSCLETLDVTFLKIDKSFVETVGTDGATSHVVQHIIEMAHALNLRMVAEGVETEEQAGFLARRGVSFAQGWLFGKPMPIAMLLGQLAASAPAEEPVSSPG